MWPKIAPLLFVLSVSMNLAVAGTWLVTAAYARPDEPELEGFMLDEIEITERQARRMGPTFREFRESINELAEQADSAREDLLDAGELDHDAINATHRQIVDIQARMQRTVIEHLIAQRDILSTQQQEHLFDALRQRAGRGRAGGMGDGQQRRRGRDGRNEPTNR